MKVEQAEQITSKAIEALSQALEEGHSETLRKYLSAMAMFHRYSLHNVMLIASQRPDATRVAGYHTWKQLGRHVKQGAKGILILAPIMHKNAEEQISQEREGERVAVGFRAAYVFDVADTDGEPLPELGTTQGDPTRYTERLKAFVVRRGIQLEYSADIYPAKGQCQPEKIILLPNLPPAEEFSVLAHEMAHSLLHQQGRRSETSKRIRETEAEAVAYVVCEGVGLKAEGSADYIRLYSGDKDMLTDSLDHIQRASAEILSAISPGD